MLQTSGPWGTGPYKLVEGFSTPGQRSDRVVLEANMDYWNKHRFPRLQRIIFDNTLSQKEAVELLKTAEGRVDLVTELRPLDTLRVAQSPFGKVVKNRWSLLTVFGMFNMRKAASPWSDVRVRQAVNLLIHRDNLIEYAAKGNGVVVPAVVPAQAFGYDAALAPYPFDPAKAQHLLRNAGHPNGLPVTLIVSEDLDVQATVVSKMLEQGGLQVALQVLDSEAYNRKVLLSSLDQPPEQQTWDIALMSQYDFAIFPLYPFYSQYVFDDMFDWVHEQPELRQLYEQVLSTVDREKQQELIWQMERHTFAHAYFLFLYNPIQLYAANKAVEFVPYATTILNLTETSVTEQHWSVRKQRAAVQE